MTEIELKMRLDAIEREIAEVKNELRQSQAMYSTVLLEQSNFFKCLVTEMDNITQQTMEATHNDYQKLRQDICDIKNQNADTQDKFLELKELLQQNISDNKNTGM